MSEWVILYRKGNNRIGFVCEGSDDADSNSMAIYDCEEDARAFVDQSAFLQSRPWQIMEVTEL